MDNSLLISDTNLYGQILKESNSPIIITDYGQSDNHIVYVNRAFEIVTGYSCTEVLGKNCRFLQGEDTDQPSIGLMARAIKTGEPCEVLLRNYKKNGELFWNNVFLFPIHNSEGSISNFVGIQHDVTERKTLELEIESSQKKLSTVLESISEGFYSLSRDWKFLYINDAGARLLGRQQEDLNNKSIWDEYPEAVNSEFYHTYHKVLEEAQPYSCESYYSPLGKWFEARAYPSPDGIVVIFQDITTRKEYEGKLVYAASHDSLTGLKNRSSSLNYLTEWLLQSKSEDCLVTVFFMDLDNFKEINDAFGHHAGDKVLATLGQRLSALESEEFICARISGDEFLFIHYSCNKSTDNTLAQTLLSTVSLPMHIDDVELSVGCSIGIASDCSLSITPDDLINRADSAMYHAKASGRFTYKWASDEPDALEFQRHKLRKELLSALHSGQFILHYQPQVDLHSQCIVGLEALIRWQHPELGLISPMVFIPIAEESNFILDLGAWVLEEAFRQLAQWAAWSNKLKMSINVSARQLSDPTLVDKLETLANKYKLTPSCIKLEITESMLVQDFETTFKILDPFKKKGFRIALDDFGTGYSNFSYLNRLPITAIKIDRSFIASIETDKKSIAVVNGIIALAKSLELTVICEGIENEAQLDILKGTECNYIQGYFISKPLDAVTLEARFLS